MDTDIKQSAIRDRFDLPSENEVDSTMAPGSEYRLNRFAFTDEMANNIDLAEHMGDGWAVPWSDLMMVMFVLFVVLYILELAEPEVDLKYQPQPIVEYMEVPEPIESPVEVPTRGANGSGDIADTVGADITKTLSINVFEESSEAVQRAELADVKVALLSDQSVKVSVEGPLLFELGKANLRDEVREFLDSLAFVIKQTPFRVRVIGHTDDKPINTNLFPSNWELSLVRASTVARYLISSGDLDPTRFTVMGRGQYAPVVENNDDSTRALNRRVEIIITRENQAEPTNREHDDNSLTRAELKTIEATNEEV